MDKETNNLPAQAANLLREAVALKNEISYLKLNPTKIGLPIRSRHAMWIEGLLKLEARLDAEITFLNRIAAAPDIKETHISCTNLKHFLAIIQICKSEANCVQILKTVRYKTSTGYASVCIDVVGNYGARWIKVHLTIDSRSGLPFKSLNGLTNMHLMTTLLDVTIITMILLVLKTMCYYPEDIISKRLHYY